MGNSIESRGINGPRLGVPSCPIRRFIIDDMSVCSNSLKYYEDCFRTAINAKCDEILININQDSDKYVYTIATMNPNPITICKINDDSAVGKAIKSTNLKYNSVTIYRENVEDKHVIIKIMVSYPKENKTINNHQKNNNNSINVYDFSLIPGMKNDDLNLYLEFDNSISQYRELQMQIYSIEARDRHQQLTYS